MKTKSSSKKSLGKRIFDFVLGFATCAVIGLFYAYMFVEGAFNDPTMPVTEFELNEEVEEEVRGFQYSVSPPNASFIGCGRCGVGITPIDIADIKSDTEKQQ